jgi:hypothetical protein
MRTVQKGDAILMFAKGQGIVGIGRAKEGPKVLAPKAPNRIRKRDSNEWRVPVDWLAWVENDADAAAPWWNSPNASFFDVTGEKYSDLTDAVKRHFLGDV